MLEKLLGAIYRGTGVLVWLCGKIAGLLVGLLVLITVADVVLRYYFSAGSIIVQELEWHIFSAIFLLGSAYTLQRDAHVRVDVLYSKLPARGKACIDILGTLVFLLPFCVIGIWVGIPFVERAFTISETSADPGGLPMRFIPKAFIVIGFLLLLIESVGFTLRAITKLYLGHESQYLRHRARQ